MEMTTRRRRISWPSLLARHPWATFLGGGATLAFLGAWACWALQLRGLPDIGDPFDVKAFESIHVSDDRNAFVEYGRASVLLQGPFRAFQRKLTPATSRDDPRSWSEAGSEWRTLLEDARQALTIYRAGSEKPDALYAHPEGLSLNTLLRVTMALQTLSRLAVLEGSRLEADGDMAGIWGWYRAVLRSSRHSGRHGFQMERNVGVALHKRAADAISLWAIDPRVDAPLLRRALGEVIAIDELTVPRSDAIKLEYLVFLHDLDNPGDLIDGFFMGHRQPGDPDDWVQDLAIPAGPKKYIHRGRFVLQSERDRAIRVSRLLVANWLAEADKPAGRRARLATTTPPIYGAGPDTPPKARALAPADLAAWYESSFLTRQFYGAPYQSGIFADRERIRQAKLVLTLADQIYRREHDGVPPPSPQALVGPVLSGLPEGYDAPNDPSDVRR